MHRAAGAPARRAAKKVNTSKTTVRPIRIVTAASLFDGHDAAINIMRRLIQKQGAEVIHLGHNRSVHDVVCTAIQEDAHSIAISSYQGGHIEYFEYMVELLKKNKSPHISIFGGGGGVILPQEVKRLHKSGVKRIYTPEDGQIMGLTNMIADLVSKSERKFPAPVLSGLKFGTDQHQSIARLITTAENDPSLFNQKFRKLLQQKAAQSKSLVIGFTGTGGAGKSSLVDEWLLRWYQHFPNHDVAVLSIDPTKKSTGGALLGDRIRMNSLTHYPIMMRSMATRGSQSALAQATKDTILIYRAFGFPIIVVETPGIGQGDSEISSVSDLSAYVMTPEFGAPSQLEKIEMLEVADFVVINKVERRGGKDAFRDVRKQYRRNHNLFHDINDDELPVFGTSASHFNDSGVNSFFESTSLSFEKKWKENYQGDPPWLKDAHENEIIWKKSQFSENTETLVPNNRIRYLSEIAESIRTYHDEVREVVSKIHDIESLERSMTLLQNSDAKEKLKELNDSLPHEFVKQLEQYNANWDAFQKSEYSYNVRDKEVKQSLINTSLSGLDVPRIAVPKFISRAEHARFAFLENFPGFYPFTGGLFPLKRKDEEPKRMFAGEGLPEDTNKRFHLLCKGEPAQRLSTAFDSVTLYGEDPEVRPDIYGKIGVSGVSISTLDDMKLLYKGFDLCSPTTSVSKTINGPAPIILAFFFNTAFDQQVDKFCKEKKTKRSQLTKKDWNLIKDTTLQSIRGTVQADILKEDQAQNTCIFSTEFALKMMGDIQEYFVQKKVRNYYSVSISGYHIAEAGANPITQLALTLSNGFTFVENYLARDLSTLR